MSNVLLIILMFGLLPIALTVFGLSQFHTHRRLTVAPQETTTRLPNVVFYLLVWIAPGIMSMFTETPITVSVFLAGAGVVPALIQHKLYRRANNVLESQEHELYLTLKNAKSDRDTRINEFLCKNAPPAVDALLMKVLELLDNTLLVESDDDCAATEALQCIVIFTTDDEYPNAKYHSRLMLERVNIVHENVREGSERTLASCFAYFNQQSEPIARMQAAYLLAICQIQRGNTIHAWMNFVWLQERFRRAQKYYEGTAVINMVIYSAGMMGLIARDNKAEDHAQDYITSAKALLKKASPENRAELEEIIRGGEEAITSQG